MSPGVIMKSLPETWRDLASFITQDRGGTFLRCSRVMQAAEMLETYDVIDECGMCGADLVKVVAFSSAAVAHYALAGDEAAEATSMLEDLVRTSGVETASGLDPRCTRDTGKRGIASQDARP